MGRKLDNAINLYMTGIRDGNPREAMRLYTGGRYTQHSTGVPDGKEGFVRFFDEFLRRNPERDIRIVRGFEDGRYVFLQAYQSLNGGKARWVTADFFDTDDEDRLIEHWDVISEYVPETPSGHTSVDGPVEISGEAETGENKKLIRTLIEEGLIGNNSTVVDASLSADRFIQHADGLPDGREPFRRLVTGEDRRLAFEEVVLFAGRGNFAAALCRAKRNGREVARVDLFRVEAGKAIEHWASEEPVPSAEDLTNGGKF
jgi:predicted SnoaL-like aldol condensation-catalyzing enzyme